VVVRDNGGVGWELRGDQGLAGEEEGAAVVFSGLGRVESKRESGMEREGASDSLEPEKRGRGACMGVCYGGGEVAVAEPRGGVARAREGQGGEARAVAGVQVTRGVCPSRRWRRGEAVAAMSGSDDRQQRSRGGARGRRRGKGGLKDMFAKTKKSRDLTVNWNFPLIQKPNEKMIKIEVVEFFKSYNFSSGLKFKNLNYKSLFYNFALNSNLIKFCPY
jgi:hypothetical protein